MPLSDIVVDTNVLVHASNDAVPFYQDSVMFLASLAAATTVLCVDEGFSIDESRNKSLIAGEYADRLVFGMLGFAVIQALATGGRIKQVSKSVSQEVRTAVKRLVPRKSRDRTFVHVARNSDDRILVSHDFDDFGDDVRAELRRRVEVQIIMASEAKPLLE